MSLLTKEDLKDSLPKSTHTLITDELVQQINTCSADPDAMEHFRSNVMGYAAVMQTGKFRLLEYLNAVQFVTYKNMGLTNIAAFKQTFPDKIKDYTARNLPDKVVHSYVSAYAKTKLVAGCFQISAIPIYITNADKLQDAINVLADLMTNAKSEKVRGDAANNLVSHLKIPEVAKVQMQVNIKESDAVTDLRETLREMAVMQQEQISSGQANALQVAHSVIVPKRD